jgi:hypothetical protein
VTKTDHTHAWCRPAASPTVLDGSLILWRRDVGRAVPSRRVILFFCPIRTSSPNRTSMWLGSSPSLRAIASRMVGQFLKGLDRTGGVDVMTWARRQLAIALAHSSRLSVYLEMPTRNSFHQRTAAWIAGIGPLSITTAKAARCIWPRNGGRPGA